jgi:hypothetical protein
MMSENREIGFKGSGIVQALIDGGNQLDTKTYLSGVISHTVKEKVNEQNAKKIEIGDRNNGNQARPDFSDLGIGEY